MIPFWIFLMILTFPQNQQKIVKSSIWWTFDCHWFLIYFEVCVISHVLTFFSQIECQSQGDDSLFYPLTVIISFNWIYFYFSLFLLFSLLIFFSFLRSLSLKIFSSKWLSVDFRWIEEEKMNLCYSVVVCVIFITILLGKSDE